MDIKELEKYIKKKKRARIMIYVSLAFSILPLIIMYYFDPFSSLSFNKNPVKMTIFISTMIGGFLLFIYYLNTLKTFPNVKLAKLEQLVIKENKSPEEALNIFKEQELLDYKTISWYKSLDENNKKLADNYVKIKTNPSK